MVIFCLSIIAFWLCQGHEAHQLMQLECFNDYIETITCSWPVEPGKNCSTDYVLLYQAPHELPEQNITDINSLPGSICQCKIRGQSFGYANKYKIKVYCKNVVIFSKDINSSRTIKPSAPYDFKTLKNKEEFLVWMDKYINEPINSNMEYEVAYMKIGGNWKMLNSTTQRMLVLKTVLEPGYTYHLKVRSRPTKDYSGVWSDWSAECQWSYDSTNWISPTLIGLVCIFIPLPVALCFYAFQLIKKFWWEKIPSPLKSSVSKQIFNKQQMNGFIFSENRIDDCKVEKISCMTKVSREWAKMEDVTKEPDAESFTFPAFQHLRNTKHDEKTPFLQFPGFGFPVLTDFPSLFPLPMEDMSLVPSDAPGYSLFNSVAKNQWAVEEDGCHPFSSNEDGGLPLTPSTYSLSPGSGREATGLTEQVGYQTFDSCVSKPWAKVAESGWDSGEEQSSETLLMPLEQGHVDSSKYMASGNQTVTTSDKEREGSGDRSTSYNFPLASVTDFLLQPFPLFPENIQSSTFLLSIPGKLECQELPTTHWGPSTSLYPPGKVT